MIREHTMSFPRKQLGRSGEEAVALYLKKNGYRVLDMNYKTKFGEIDIVASKKGTIVFVEVKTRVGESSTYFPEDNIDSRKKRKLRKLGELYLLLKNYPPFQPWQIDVVAVETDPMSGSSTIRHIEQAVTN